MILSVLGFFLCGWFVVSVPSGQKKCLIWFQFSWVCWGLFCFLLCGLSLKTFHVHLKRMCILLLWDERFYIYHLSLFDLGLCSMPQYPCWFFAWMIYPIFFFLVKYFHSLFVLIFFFLVKLSQDTLRFKNKVGITGAGQPSYLYRCSSASGVKVVQEQCSSISVGNPPLLNSVVVGSRTFIG